MRWGHLDVSITVHDDQGGWKFPADKSYHTWRLEDFDINENNKEIILEVLRNNVSLMLDKIIEDQEEENKIQQDENKPGV